MSESMREAQTTLEYAVLIACLVGALLAMHIYTKRAMMGRLRQTADELGQQYAPKKTIGNFIVDSDSNVTTITETKEDPLTQKLQTNTAIYTDYDRETRSGSETVLKWKE